MSLPTPKPPTADGNPPEYNAMKDLAERCAKAEAELERVKIERDEAYVARDFADAALERVQKQVAAYRDLLERYAPNRWTMNTGLRPDEVRNAIESSDAGANYIRRDQVKPLVECLQWLHAGSICSDPATSSASRKDCPICKALNHAKSIGL